MGANIKSFRSSCATSEAKCRPGLGSCIQVVRSCQKLAASGSQLCSFLQQMQSQRHERPDSDIVLIYSFVALQLLMDERRPGMDVEASVTTSHAE